MADFSTVKVPPSGNDRKRFYNVTTDADGQFVFAQVVPVTYRLRVRLCRCCITAVFARGGLRFSIPGVVQILSLSGISSRTSRVCVPVDVSGKLITPRVKQGLQQRICLQRIFLTQHGRLDYADRYLNARWDLRGPHASDNPESIAA
jgi:hypothetical protein